MPGSPVARARRALVALALFAVLPLGARAEDDGPLAPAAVPEAMPLQLDAPRPAATLDPDALAPVPTGDPRGVSRAAPRRAAVVAPREPREPIIRRNDAVVLNAAALAGNPFVDGRAWRVELGVEQRVPRAPRFTNAVLFGGGSVRVPGYRPEVVLDLAGQIRWYAVGNFDGGLYVGGQLGFWLVGQRPAWAPGVLVGMKLAAPSGPTLDVQICAQWPADFFPARGDAAPFRDVWRTISPGLLVGIGFAPLTEDRVVTRPGTSR